MKGLMFTHVIPETATAWWFWRTHTVCNIGIIPNIVFQHIFVSKCEIRYQSVQENYISKFSSFLKAQLKQNW